MTQSEIMRLEREILRHRTLYDAGEPEITDQSYDLLVKQLRAVAHNSPVLAQVGDTPVGDWRNQMTHSTPMLSLDKLYGDDALRKWATAKLREIGGRISGISPVSTNTDFIVQPKLDGVSLSLRYIAVITDKWALRIAGTRGDGKLGEDVTVNVVDVNGIVEHFFTPHTFSAPTQEVRGEVLMRRSVFNSKYADRFANPRNVVAGSLLRKHGDKSVLGDLEFIAYDLLSDSLPHHQRMAELADRGFRTVLSHRADGVDALLKAVAALTETCKTLDFETDGIVIKMDSNKVCAHLGATEHHPNWAVAYKFQGESGETKLVNVVWQTSRSGTITPVAIVEPVQLSGVTITRATLHNLGQMERMGGLHLGDTLAMTRRGGVIPHVEAVMERAGADCDNTNFVVPPKRCPACGARTQRTGDILKCGVPASCVSARANSLLHWAQTLDMEGWGPGVIGDLLDRGVLHTPLDFYRMTQEDLEACVGEKTAEKLLCEVQRVRVVPLDRLIKALGIREIGSTASRRLAEEFSTLEELRGATEADLRRVPGMGSVMVDELFAGLNEHEDLLDALLEEIEIVPVKVNKPNGDAQGQFVGQKVVFTGPLTDMERSEAQALVRSLGADTPSGLTKETTILVVGDNASPAQTGKREKARAYNAKGARIEVITEAEFTKRLALALETMRTG